MSAIEKIGVVLTLVSMCSMDSANLAIPAIGMLTGMAMVYGANKMAASLRDDAAGKHDANQSA